MSYVRVQLKSKGWFVKKDTEDSYSLKNGPWNAVGNFRTEETAWKWLERIQEPRSPADIDAARRAKEKEALRERSFIKHNL